MSGVGFLIEVGSKIQHQASFHPTSGSICYFYRHATHATSFVAFFGSLRIDPKHTQLVVQQRISEDLCHSE
jgi:hypothetical protein